LYPSEYERAKGRSIESAAIKGGEISAEGLAFAGDWLLQGFGKKTGGKKHRFNEA